MDKLIEFFNKSLGDWESHRTYMYPSSNKIDSLTTLFTWTTSEEFVYQVEWGSIKGQGSMILKLKENLIERNVGYFTDKPTISNILEFNSNILVTSTCYNNSEFIETIEFLDDSHRTRRTIGYKENNKNSVILSGSYQEFKIL